MKIIRINAIWCPGCLVMRPVWNKIQTKYPTINFEDLDFDFDEELVKKWNVGNILPVAIVVDNSNNEISRIIGEKNKKELTNIIEAILGESNEK